MLSRTHDLAAFASLLTVAVYISPQRLGVATVFVALVANIVGALLPDADQASNRLWDLLPGGNFLGKFLRHIFLSHRTLSHSLLGFYLIYQANLWLIPKLFNSTFVSTSIIINSIMIGYISHLVADSLTEEGVPLLFPFSWKFGFPPFRRWRLKTGHWFENNIVFPGIILYIFWLFYSSWQILLSTI